MQRQFSGLDEIEQTETVRAHDAWREGTEAVRTVTKIDDEGDRGR